MTRKRELRPVRKMKPVILVLCEGESEERYVEMLRRHYRLPIKIVSKVVGQKINQRLVSRIQNEMKLNASERVSCFLMYDADVPAVVQNIRSCKNAAALLSRPCLEAWFLAHSEPVPATDISTTDCLDRLKALPAWENYRKGFLSDKQEDALWQNRHAAAKNIPCEPSEDSAFSTVGGFIETLENIKT